MMKKIFCLVCAVLFVVMFSVTSYAVTPYTVGGNIFSLKMNGNLSDESYWYLYYGKEGSELSNEMAYEGKTSLKVNIDKINEKDTSYPFMLHTRSVSNKNGISDSDIYCELFTSSTDAVRSNLVFVAYFDMPDGTQRVFKTFATEEANAQWKKHSCVIDISKVEGFSKCNIGVLFPKNTSLSGNFYIDNINIKTCPKKIVANDVYSDTVSADLNDLRVFGVDKNGNQKLITEQALLNYRVVDGEADIIDNRLVSRLTQPGEVLLEAEFLGKKTTFAVMFDYESVYLSATPYVTDQMVNLSITNASGEDEKVTGLIMIFDDNGLYNAYMLSDFINAGETKLIQKKINIPAILNNPDIQFFFWGNSGEMSEIIEVVER